MATILWCRGPGLGTAGHQTGKPPATTPEHWHWPAPFGASQTSLEQTLQNSTYRCGLRMAPPHHAQFTGTSTAFTPRPQPQNTTDYPRDLTGLHDKKHSQPAFPRSAGYPHMLVTVTLRRLWIFRRERRAQWRGEIIYNSPHVCNSLAAASTSPSYFQRKGMIPNSLELCKKREDPLAMSCFLEADVIVTPMSSRRQFVCRASCVPSEVWAWSVKFRMALFSFRRMLSEAETSCSGLSQIVEECRWVATLAPKHQSKW